MLFTTSIDPVAAYARTLPSAYTSLAGPASPDCCCSGAMKPGVPGPLPITVTLGSVVYGRVRPALGWFLLVAPIVILVAYECAPHSRLQQFTELSFSADRIDRLARDTLIAALFSSHIVGFAAVSPRLAPWLERHARAIRWIAGATFSLYLAHLPIMHLLAALSPWPKSSVLTLGLLLAATPALCLLFAEISERRKEAWRNAATIGLRAVESFVATRRLGERSRAAARSPR